MQIHEEIGCVYKRVKKGRRGRRKFEFERVAAIKKPGPEGSTLLIPLPVAPTAPAKRQSFITITLAEGITAQLSAKTNGHAQEPRAPRNDGSAQCSPLIIGTGKHAGVGNRFKV